MDNITEEPKLLDKGKKIPKWKIVSGIVIVILVLIIGVQIVLADKYKAVVNVVPEIEGERGLEKVVGLNPTEESLDFGDLSRDLTMTRFVNIKSEGNMPVFVMVWKFGEVSDLIKLNKNYFKLNPGEEFRLEFTIYVPPSAEHRKYSGNVWIFKIPVF